MEPMKYLESRTSQIVFQVNRSGAKWPTRAVWCQFMLDLRSTFPSYNAESRAKTMRLSSCENSLLVFSNPDENIERGCSRRGHARG
jgi:hypothetical protein